MLIKGQSWEETPTHLIIKLNEPYWGAWKKYGWEPGTAGISISSDAYRQAGINNKKILVKIKKYGNYEIGLEAIVREGRPFRAKNTSLICIPRSSFKKYEEKKS